MLTSQIIQRTNRVSAAYSDRGGAMSAAINICAQIAHGVQIEQTTYGERRAYLRAAQRTCAELSNLLESNADDMASRAIIDERGDGAWRAREWMAAMKAAGLVVA